MSIKELMSITDWFACEFEFEFDDRSQKWGCTYSYNHKDRDGHVAYGDHPWTALIAFIEYEMTTDTEFDISKLNDIMMYKRISKHG